jgi:protocatechuate 3,4-dioxygenase beta subunit
MTEHPDAHHDGEDHDRGLAFDLSTLVQRRRVLQMLGGAGLLALAGCGRGAADAITSGSTTSTSAASAASAASSSSGSSSASVATTSGSASTSASAIPEETAGPYPGDGSNGVNALTQSGIVRSDIRASFGSSSTVADGVPATVKLTLVEAGTSTPLSGKALYLWHCDRLGRYSLYSNGVTAENYLRGVQEADDAGTVTFTTIFPACYSGRWPHMHFEVYPSLAAATGARSKLATSQLAIPEDICETVYATTGYEASVKNLAQVSLSTDNVFSDGASLETPTVTGSVADGYVISLTVGVKS